MEFMEATADSLREQLSDPLSDMLGRYETSDQSGGPDESTPVLLGAAFEKLFDVIASADANPQTSPHKITELGEYALELFDQSLLWSRELGLDEAFDKLQLACISMARWIAARDGEILTLEPVVDALARHANHTQDLDDLLALHQLIVEIMHATASAIQQDLEKTNPGRPWRVLLLNRAIIATRTHQPDVMESAYQSLVEHLPEEASKFFSEGMKQMDALNYPSHVREIVDRYHKTWSINRSLH